jgi:hypothetical protein
MGLLDTILGTKEITDIAGGIGKAAKDIRDIATGADVQAKLLEIENAAMQMQAKINEVEAASPSLFIAGGRPAIIWVCAAGLAWQYILGPVLTWGVAISGAAVTLPIINGDGLMSLTIALLGLGTMRTYEKVKGVQKNH